jgi:putative glycosyltransferase (TIGR04372 family)
MPIIYDISELLNEIKLGGSKVLLRKTKKLLITLICFPNYVFITPFVLITRILRPFICIRFGPIRNDVIGHFAFDTESYLTETIINKTDTLDLFYLQSPESPNSQWEQMVKRHFKPNSIFKYFDRINRIIPGWKNHFVKLNNTGSRDTNNFFKKIHCQISFSIEEIEAGEKYLRQVGLSSDQEFVCMIARDEVYKDKFLNRKGHRDWSYHSYRNSDISNYVKSAEILTKHNYSVFRMGKGVNGEIKTNNDRIIDYSNSVNRSDFLDIYLSTNCKFFIVGEAGLQTVPLVFRIPIVFVNLSAIEYALTSNSNIISIPKQYWLKQEKRIMTFKEIYKSGAGRLLRTKQYENMGIELIENTPAEILDVSMEMHHRLNNTWTTTEEDEYLQSKFWRQFPKSELHGEFLGKIGSNWLSQNRILLD